MGQMIPEDLPRKLIILDDVSWKASKELTFATDRIRLLSDGSLDAIAAPWLCA
jgi:hypothetical protein